MRKPAPRCHWVRCPFAEGHLGRHGPGARRPTFGEMAAVFFAPPFASHVSPNNALTRVLR